MERKWNRVAVLSTFAFGMGLTAMQANAQQGTFNLPVQAHWGTAVLEPGEHRIRMPIPLGQRYFYVRGGEGTQVTVPLSTEILRGSNKSFLHLSRVNGEYYVDAYQSGVSGQRFTFSTPKAVGGKAHKPSDQEAKLITVTGS